MEIMPTLMRYVRRLLSQVHLLKNAKMEQIVEQSRMEYNSSLKRDAASGSSRHGPSNRTQHEESSYLRKFELKQEIASLDAEIADIRRDVMQLEEQCKLRAKDKDGLMKELRALDQRQTSAQSDASKKGKGRESYGMIDYSADFDWSPELRLKMKRVFGINDFRLCQKG
jgi:ATP-dependent DNA helicase Q1